MGDILFSEMQESEDETMRRREDEKQNRIKNSEDRAIDDFLWWPSTTQSPASVLQKITHTRSNVMRMRDFGQTELRISHRWNRKRG